jgi:multidrug resistance efflux pump
MNKPRGEGAWWRSAGQRRTWVTPQSPSTNATRSAAPSVTRGGNPSSAAPPDASDPGVNKLIDGVMGDSVAAPVAVAAPPRPRQPIQWPPRPATEPETPVKPAGLLSRAKAAATGTRPNSHPGLRTRSRVVVVLALAAAIVAAAVLTTRALAVSTSTNFSGVLAAESPIQIDFANSGTIATIDVVPGQNVSVGQVLATEAEPVATVAVHSDQAALAADEVKLADLIGKTGAAAEAQAKAQFTKVQSLASAQEARGAASVDQESAILAADQQTLSSEEAQLGADQANYNSKCKGLGSGTCAALSRDVSQDQIAVGNDQSRVTEAQAALSSAEGINSSLNNLATQETTLAQALPVSTSETLLDDITAARVSVDGELTQLAADEQALEQGYAVSPYAGKVADVSCVSGELVTSDGCRIGPVTSGSGVPGSSGSSGPSSVNQPSGVEPLITIYAAPGLEAIAQVPEVDITSIRTGETATISVDALGGQSFTAKVAAVEQIPVDVAGSVYYDVVLVPSGSAWSDQLLAGMTANISTP